MKKERIPSLDFIRVVCTLGIIANHFSHSAGNDVLDRFLSTYPCGIGDVGKVLVVVFFILSGAALYYSNEQPGDLKRFYVKRWKAVYPSFYIAYAVFFVWYIRFNRTLFTGKSVWTLVFTLLGLDGYLARAVADWYILGEWFLGAIILCYLLYPLITACMKKSEAVTCLVLMGAYALTINWRMLNQDAFRNLFSCLISFSCGIVLMKHGWFRSRTAGLISLLLYLLTAFLPLRIESSLLAHVQGLMLFLGLAAAGEYAMKNPVFSGIIRKGAQFSFEVFLVHHILVAYVLHFLHPQGALPLLAVLALAILIAGIAGYLLWRVRICVMRLFSGRKAAGKP